MPFNGVGITLPLVLTTRYPVGAVAAAVKLPLIVEIVWFDDETLAAISVGVAQASVKLP